MTKTKALLTVPLLLASLAVLHAAEFFVSPTGNDTDAGTKAKPFATLERARDAVRQSKLQDPKSKIEILVRGGL